MDEFSYEIAPEDFLDEDCLLCKVAETFGVEICSFIVAVNFTSVIGPEMSLYLCGCCLFSQELFAFDVHLKLRLNLKGSRIVTTPSLLALVGSEIIHLFYCPYQAFFLPRQFH